MKILKKYKIPILIFIIFVISRLPSLGFDTFNTDVWKWKSRSYDFGSGVFTLNFEKTIQKYHPGVTLMWINSVSIKLFNLYFKITTQSLPADNDIGVLFGLHFIQKLLIVIVLGFLASLLYITLSKLFGIRYALIAIFLFSFEPLYIALSREIHLEGLMSTFMILSFVYYYYYLTNKLKRYFYLSALFSSLAILTKTSAIFMLPYIVMISVVDRFLSDENKSVDKNHQDKKIPQLVRENVLWVVSVIVFFILIWPAMWTHPLEALTALYNGIFDIGVEGGHPQLFLGKWVQDPGPLFYLVVFFVRSSLYLYLGFIGFTYLNRRIIDNKNKRFILYLLLFFIFYFIELTIPSKKLDRYFLPAFLSIILIIAFFYEYFIFKILKNARQIRILICIFISLGLFTTLWIHPNYFSYYSPFTGGLRLGIYTIEPKWMIGQHEIVNFFSTLPQAGSFKKFEKTQSVDSLLYKSQIEEMLTIAFPEKYYTQIWPFITKMGARAVINELTPQAKKTQFFVYPVYDDNSNQEERFKLQKIGVIKLRGIEIYNVYQRIGD